MRYRVSDLPGNGTGAFAPIPSTNPPASSYGLTHIAGSPGTDPVPAPAPQRDYLPSLTKTGGRDSAQSSEVVPDYILPAVYVASAKNMGPGVHVNMRRRRFTELPVPAVDPLRVPQVAQSSRKTGGRTVQAWPRAFQRWPVIGSAGTVLTDA